MKIQWALLAPVYGAVLLAALPSARADYDDYGESRPTFYVGLGVLSEDMSMYTDDQTSVGTSIFDEVYTAITVSARLRLAGEWLYLVPTVSITPFGISSPEDSGATTRVFTPALLASINIGFMDFSVGPGWLHRWVSASGGTTTLNNGNSQSTFALPPQGVSENSFYWETGVGFNILKFRVDADLLITDTFNSRRATDGLLTVTYGLL